MKDLEEARIRISDIIWRTVRSYPLKAESGYLEINMAGSNNGVCFYSLVVDKSVVQTRRMVVIQ